MRGRRKTSVGIARANREGKREGHIFPSLSTAHGMALIFSHFSYNHNSKLLTCGYGLLSRD